jgi:hypothetical protein
MSARERVRETERSLYAEAPGFALGPVYIYARYA